MSQGIAIMRKLNRRGVKAFAVLSFMAFTSCAIAGRGAFHLFTPPPRDLPHARCSPRSGPRGRTSHAAQDPAHLSTMWPSGDIRRRKAAAVKREIQSVQRGGRTAGAAGKNEGAVLNWEEVKKAIDAILKRGNDAEIRRKGDGYIVLEVKKTIKYSTPA